MKMTDLFHPRLIVLACVNSDGCDLMSERDSKIKVRARISADLTVLGIVDDGGLEPVYLVWHHKSWCPMGCKVTQKLIVFRQKRTFLNFGARWLGRD